MKNIEKTLNEELRNNDCIENLVNAIDSKKSIYDAFVVDGKLVIVFNDELETNEVEQIQTMLKRMDGCGEVFSDEFELGYKGNFKSLTLDLLTDNVSIGKFEQGGEMNNQNSIEWLFKQMGNIAAGYITEMNQQEILDHAKQMHKQEIMDAWKNADTHSFTEENANYYAERYYNETFLGAKRKYAKGGEIHMMSKKDKERFNELQKKDNQDKLTKVENVEYENLLQQYKKTKEYKDYFMTDKFAKGGQVNKISTTNQVKRNLRGSGAFTLELEMAVYVPSTTFADQIISKTLFQKRIQEVEKYLSKLFGGYSSTAIDGGYVSKEKGLIKEDAAKVTAFGTEVAIKKNFKPLMRQISKWCESWGQESMGFEFEGDLYYVEKNAKFSKGGKIDKKPKFVKNAKK